MERAVAEATRRRDYEAAARHLVDGYGAEIRAFLLARTRNDADASEAYSVFLEGVWRSLPGFEARATVRVWAYTIAQRAVLRVRAARCRGAARNVPLSHMGAEVADRVRTETRPYLRTENKERLAALRDGLASEDQMLLMLRVTRGLPWEDVARVFLAEQSEVTDAMLHREAARLRKRFQAVKQRLRDSTTI